MDFDVKMAEQQFGNRCQSHIDAELENHQCCFHLRNVDHFHSVAVARQHHNELELALLVNAVVMRFHCLFDLYTVQK